MRSKSIVENTQSKKNVNELKSFGDINQKHIESNALASDFVFFFSDSNIVQLDISTLHYSSRKLNVRYVAHRFMLLLLDVNFII